MDAQIDAAWRESVEEEVKRRLAARGLDDSKQLPPMPGVRLLADELTAIQNSKNALTNRSVPQ